MQGPAAVLLLVGLIASGALSVASWGYAKRPAELALATGTIGVSMAFAVIHVLGWAGYLTPSAIWGGVLAVSLTPTLATGLSREGRSRLGDAARSLHALAFEGVVAPAKARSSAALGLASVLALSLWTLWLAYLAPSSGWDGVMYHEPMVGFALQNRGFSPVDLESANRMLTPVDGYPRLSENLMLLLVAMWDRRLIDALPSLLYPLLLVASYVGLRRFVQDRLTALGLACGMMLIPGIALQLRSTYVDLAFLTFLAAAIGFVCRPRLRGWDLWLGGAAIGLLGASKVTGFIVAPLVGFVGVVLVATQAIGRRQPKLVLHLLGGVLLVVALAGPTYARNVALHDNPLWPGAVEVESLGIDWEGPLDISNMNHPTELALEYFFGPPRAGEQHHDTKDNGYGNVPPFVVPPLALLALLLALWRVPFGPDRRAACWLLLLTVPLLATFAMSPGRHWARLNLHVVFALFLLVGWLASRRRLLGEAISAALIIGGLVTLYWSEPAWDVSRDRARRLAGLSAEERAVQRDGLFTLMPTETARARETELGPGSLLVFETVPWAGLLWNERFDNRVEHIDPREHRGDAWVAEAERREATWAVVRGHGPLARAFRRSARWELVGPTDGTNEAPLAFRFLGAEEPPAAEAHAGDAPAAAADPPVVDAGPPADVEAPAAPTKLPLRLRGTAPSTGRLHLNRPGSAPSRPNGVR